jgi:hypothetical protein
MDLIDFSTTRFKVVFTYLRRELFALLLMLSILTNARAG